MSWTSTLEWFAAQLLSGSVSGPKLARRPVFPLFSCCRGVRASHSPKQKVGLQARCCAHAVLLLECLRPVLLLESVRLHVCRSGILVRTHGVGTAASCAGRRRRWTWMRRVLWEATAGRIAVAVVSVLRRKFEYLAVSFRSSSYLQSRFSAVLCAFRTFVFFTFSTRPRTRF